MPLSRRVSARPLTGLFYFHLPLLSCLATLLFASYCEASPRREALFSKMALRLIVDVFRIVPFLPVHLSAFSRCRFARFKSYPNHRVDSDKSDEDAQIPGISTGYLRRCR